jgi:hypothetical protein
MCPPEPPPAPAREARPAADVVRNAQHRHDDDVCDDENAISAAATVNDRDGGVILVADVDDVMFFSLGKFCSRSPTHARLRQRGSEESRSSTW